MNDSHLKRFFLEVYNDIDLYYDYLIGNTTINHDVYYKWYKDIKHGNEIFANCLINFNRIKWKDPIVESALADYFSVAKHLHNPSIINVKEFEKFKIEKQELGSSINHYICEGYFEDTLEQIYNVLDKGSFTVGICGEKQNCLYQEVVDYYSKLRHFLLKNGYQTSAFETNCNSKRRVYLLMYDHKLKKRVTK